MLHTGWGPDLGKPLCFRLPHIPIYEGLIIVIPTREDGPVELQIFLDDATVRRLREDKEWTAFAVEYQ
jgi:hypothetical protein